MFESFRLYDAVTELPFLERSNEDDVENMAIPCLEARFYKISIYFFFLAGMS